VSTNSPYELIRFASREDGTHLLIIFRKPHDPKQSLTGIRHDQQGRHVRAVRPHGQKLRDSCRAGLEPACKRP
jgi:REP element-mobilizing transposase RayT